MRSVGRISTYYYINGNNMGSVCMGIFVCAWKPFFFIEDIARTVPIVFSCCPHKFALDCQPISSTELFGKGRAIIEVEKCLNSGESVSSLPLNRVFIFSF